MRNRYFTCAGVTALLLLSAAANAGSQYPEPFEPKVIYQDTDYIAQNEASTPEAVIVAEVAENDSGYPADFEPRVIYQDTAYIEKHDGGSVKTAVSASEEPETTASAVNDEAVVATDSEAGTEAAESSDADSDANDSIESYGPGLVILLGLVAFYLMMRAHPEIDEDEDEEASPTFTKDPSGLSGVQRYLQKQASTSSETGVGRYLEKQAAAAARVTGVERYLQKSS